MKKKLTNIIALIVITTMLLSGCASTASTDATSGAEVTNAATSTDTTEDQASSVETTSAIVVDTEFTASDLEVGYEESSATYITLKNSGGEVTGDGAVAKDGVITISDEGTYVISGKVDDGQIVVAAEEGDKVQIVLNGVTIHCSDSAPIYIKSADKVFITLEENTVNTLTDSTEYVQNDGNTIDGVIFSTADLTINGEGTLNITANYKHGIVSKDALVITGGIFDIKAVKDAINGKDCVKIKEGTFKLSASTGNGIQSKNAEDTSTGYVYIEGGTITITESKEGIEGTAIVIKDGTIDITASDDGLNASSGDNSTSSTTTTDSVSTTDTTATTAIELSSTTTTDAKTATDASTTTDATSSATVTDGGRGMGGFGGDQDMFENDTNCYISIEGGTLTINAAGDGIDTNGSLYISGGSTYVSGPTDNGNAGLDYNGTADITGGTIVIAGSSGMAQGFSDTSTQYSILYNFANTCEAGTEITLTDSDGNAVLSYTPDKAYQSVVISTPELESGATYTLTAGVQTADITLSSIVTSNGQNGMGGQPGQGGMPNGQPGHGGMERPQR